MIFKQRPLTFWGGLCSVVKGDEDILFPFAILLDKFRPLMGKLPNKASKLHRRRAIRIGRMTDFIKDDHIDINGIRFPLLNEQDEELLFNGIILESLAPYLFDNNTFTDDVHTQSGGVIYGLVNDTVNVTVCSGDVVIDAGAWIGDFAAYASICGATTYAFEPTPQTFDLLVKTSKLNKNMIPVNKGLSDAQDELKIFVNGEGNSGANTFRADASAGKEAVDHIATTTLDDFVQENSIKRIDFIKSDIEGFERNLLRGARNTLAEFAPKLAISTYHLPDDKEVLEKIILEANPKYRVVHKKEILFADAR